MYNVLLNNTMVPSNNMVDSLFQRLNNIVMGSNNFEVDSLYQRLCNIIKESHNTDLHQHLNDNELNPDIIEVFKSLQKLKDNIFEFDNEIDSLIYQLNDNKLVSDDEADNSLQHLNDKPTDIPDTSF